jgi:hypothetical protein
MKPICLFPFWRRRCSASARDSEERMADHDRTAAIFVKSGNPNTPSAWIRPYL